MLRDKLRETETRLRGKTCMEGTKREKYSSEGKERKQGAKRRETLFHNSRDHTVCGRNWSQRCDRGRRHPREAGAGTQRLCSEVGRNAIPECRNLKVECAGVVCCQYPGHPPAFSLADLGWRIRWLVSWFGAADSPTGYLRWDCLGKPLLLGAGLSDRQSSGFPGLTQPSC